MGRLVVENGQLGYKINLLQDVFAFQGSPRKTDLANVTSVEDASLTKDWEHPGWTKVFGSFLPPFKIAKGFSLHPTDKEPVIFWNVWKHPENAVKVSLDPKKSGRRLAHTWIVEVPNKDEVLSTIPPLLTPRRG